MSLIEKLGGYELTNGFYKRAVEHGFVLEEIKDALLEYRRKHGIFEVGDKVVYKGEAGLSGLFEIEILTKTGKPKTVKTKRFGNFPCRYCEVQHATEKEITQGYRDE